MNMPRALTIPIASGSEPELIDIDDASEAIGVEPETDEFSYPVEVWNLNPTGYCEYSMADHFTRCIHCGRKSEL
jgi:hypothetical protein